MQTFFSDKKRWTTADVARLLVSNNALTAVTIEDAIEFVKRMTPRRVRQGTVLFHEGEKNPNFMMFILQGDAIVESFTTGNGQPLVINLLGEGAIIGELGIIDNKARSATVTASSEMALAIMDRASFAQMVKEDPCLACNLLGKVLQSVGNRLRDSNRKVHTLTMINKSLHAELESGTQSTGTLPAPAPAATASTPLTPLLVGSPPDAPPGNNLLNIARPTMPADPGAQLSGPHWIDPGSHLKASLQSRLDVLATLESHEFAPPSFVDTQPI